MTRTDPSPDTLARMFLGTGGRLLVAGPMGAGKSTLVAALVDALDRPCPVISADPGQPLFGPPGACSRGWRTFEGWRVVRTEGLGSLDALRFRMPLVDTVRRLATGGGPLVVDAPGVHRGMAAAELLTGLVRAANLHGVLWLAPPDDDSTVQIDLRAAGAHVLRVRSAPEATCLSPTEREARRSGLWDDALADMDTVRLFLDRVLLTGALPPHSLPEAWAGRQAVLLDSAGDTVAMGQVEDKEPDALVLRVTPRRSGPVRAVVIRDAWRDPGGSLRTAPRHAPQPGHPGPSLAGPIQLPSVPDRASAFTATLIGGLLADPMLRLRHASGYSLALDLGDHGHLPAKVAHDLRWIGITHAHMDHFSGFPWLLRNLVAHPVPVTLVGPPGLASRVASFVDGFTWDRIGDAGPTFRVGELHGEVLRWAEVKAGHGRTDLDDTEAPGGVVLHDDDVTVRARVVDHGTPVLAFSVREPMQHSIRPEALEARGWAPGPWLGVLKRHLAAGEREALLAVPTGEQIAVADLADALTVARPGLTLAYATDLADTPENRAVMVDLAGGVDLLVLEASFLPDHAARARATGHLTARACGEIAAEAGVGLLVPFHFSHRYADRPDAVINEVRTAFDRVWSPLDG